MNVRQQVEFVFLTRKININIDCLPASGQKKKKRFLLLLETDRSDETKISRVNRDISLNLFWFLRTIRLISVCMFVVFSKCIFISKENEESEGHEDDIASQIIGDKKIPHFIFFPSDLIRAFDYVHIH